MRCDDCIKYAEVCYACEPVRKLESIIGDNGIKPPLCAVFERLTGKEAFYERV